MDNLRKGVQFQPVTRLQEAKRKKEELSKQEVQANLRALSTVKLCELNGFHDYISLNSIHQSLLTPQYVTSLTHTKPATKCLVCSSLSPLSMNRRDSVRAIQCPPQYYFSGKDGGQNSAEWRLGDLIQQDHETNNKIQDNMAYIILVEAEYNDFQSHLWLPKNVILSSLACSVC